jgi:ubiquinone/menaquinone biosynthesis C-methylase UbiE
MSQTAENCVAYVVPHVAPTMKILDVGCGAGALTCYFAKFVPDGAVVGLDQNEDGLVVAREQAASKGIANISFVAGNVLSLGYSDGEFDVVHSHQVFHHVDASAALKEMMRVTKPGGVVATRDTSHILHWPPTKEIDEFISISDATMEASGGNSNTGAKYRRFSREAGFQEKDICIKASSWCYSTKNSIESYCS